MIIKTIINLILGAGCWYIFLAIIGLVSVYSPIMPATFIHLTECGHNSQITENCKFINLMFYGLYELTHFIPASIIFSFLVLMVQKYLNLLISVLLVPIGYTLTHIVLSISSVVFFPLNLISLFLTLVSWGTFIVVYIMMYHFINKPPNKSLNQDARYTGAC